MIDTTGTRGVLRSNQAMPAAPQRRAAPRDGHNPPYDATDVWPEGRPNLLARVARAARLAVREVRRPGEQPLPHLYRGRDLERRRDAA